MNINFKERVVVITGAGSGLGRAYALLLASRGARVVVNDTGGAVDGSGSSSTPAQAVGEEIEQAGGTATANYDDVSTTEGAESLVRQTLAAYDRLDALICNAGILRDKTLLKMPPEDFDSVMRVHLNGTVNAVRAALPVMRERAYGRIVVTTSASGLYGNFGQTNYAAAKLAVVGFMNALRLETAKHNILVNAVAPLAVTRLGANVFPAEAAPRLTPERVAGLVAYLCSDLCRTSGHIIAAGANYFARVAIVEAAGIRFDDRREAATPEEIATVYERIASLNDARTFDDAHAEFARVLDRES